MDHLVNGNSAFFSAEREGNFGRNPEALLSESSFKFEEVNRTRVMYWRYNTASTKLAPRIICSVLGKGSLPGVECRGAYCSKLA